VIGQRGHLRPGAQARIAEWREIFEDALNYARDFMPRQQVFALGGVWKGMTWAGNDWSAATAVPKETLERVVGDLPEGRESLASAMQQVERTERVLKTLWRERNQPKTGWTEQYRNLEIQSEQVRRTALSILQNLLG
jgi:hypothetical protein